MSKIREIFFTVRQLNLIHEALLYYKRNLFHPESTELELNQLIERTKTWN